MASEFHYEGSELELFKRAVTWKAYYASRLRPVIQGRVLEVGAGIGATTEILAKGHRHAWVCLEPDGAMAGQIAEKIRSGAVPANCTVRQGTTASLTAADKFDTILYVDVLEHIEQDAAELSTAAAHLNANGHLVVLAPAYQSLFSAFDRTIGHHRRYSRKSLTALNPDGLALKQSFHLDSIGTLLSLANRFLLRSSQPTASQIEFWDKAIVPLSRVVDPVLGYQIGKTIVTIWQK